MATINGTTGPDSLTGTASADTINAYGGADTVRGNAGGDLIYGGDGTDSLFGDAGADLIYAGNDNDTVSGGTENDTLYGEAGNDSLLGDEGNDSLIGDTGTDVLRGGAGTDSLYGGNDNDTIEGGADNDSLYGGSGTDTADYSSISAAVNVNIASGSATGQGTDLLNSIENVIGSILGDTITGDGNANSLSGNDGADQLYGAAGTDTLDGGAGNDSLYGGTNTDLLYGGNDDDYLDGGSSTDSLYGGIGNDTLLGGSSADVLDGGTGTDAADYTGSAAVNVNLQTNTATGGDAAGDTFNSIENVIGSANNDSITGDDATGNVLYGAAGADTLSGGGGADTLYGGAGIDSLYGGNDNDVLVGGSEADAQFGGAGTDTSDYSTSSAGVNVNLTNNTGTGGDAAGDTFNSIENLTGSASADTLVGTNTANVLYGGGGADSLDARSGDDVVAGGAGNDTVAGGFGADTLSGDDGSDRIYGGDAGDSITGGIGDDTIYGDSDAPGVWTYDFYNKDFSSANGQAFTIESGTFVGSGTTNDWNLLSMAAQAGRTEANPEDFGIIMRSSYTATESGTFTFSTTSDDGSTLRILDADGNPLTINTGGTNGTFLNNDYHQAATTRSGTVTLTAGQTYTIEIRMWENQGEQVLTASMTVPSGATSSLIGNTNFASSPYNVGADTITGGDGNDSILAEAGNDSVTGDAGADTIYGGTGADTIDGRTENDSLYGDAGNDVLTGADGADQIFGGADNDQTYGGAGNDSLFGGDGTDLLDGGADNDSLSGDAGNDTLYGGDGLDQLYGGSENDSLFGGAGSDSLYGGTGDDTLAGGANGDFISAGSGMDYGDYSASNAGVNVNLTSGVGLGGDAQGDTVAGVDGLYGSAYDDTLTGYDGQSTVPGDSYTNVFYGAAGNDLLYGMAGGDQLFGGADNDTVYGGADADQILGGSGDDSLLGEGGADQILGEAGDDRIIGGALGDALYGGDDRDTFIVNLGTDGIGDAVDGGEGGVDADILDLTGAGPLKVIYSPGNPENGTVQFLDPTDRHVIGTLSFTNVETVVPCFTPGTMIETAQGSVAVEALRPGDLVWTRDHGLQPLRWIGGKTLDMAQLQAQPMLAPVRIAAGALGRGQPLRDMLVSPQHRVLVAGSRAELLFGEDELLVAAVHLVGQPGIIQLDGQPVRYIHLMFDHHEIVLSDGLWTESFQPGDRTMAGMDAGQRAELDALFPGITAGRLFPAARRALKSHEARVLFAA